MSKYILGIGILTIFFCTESSHAHRTYIHLHWIDPMDQNIDSHIPFLTINQVRVFNVLLNYIFHPSWDWWEFFQIPNDQNSSALAAFRGLCNKVSTFHFGLQKSLVLRKNIGWGMPREQFRWDLLGHIEQLTLIPLLVQELSSWNPVFEFL